MAGVIWRGFPVECGEVYPPHFTENRLQIILPTQKHLGSYKHKNICKGKEKGEMSV